MIPNQEYDQTRVEFEDEWSRSNIEDLLQTNHYKRTREERRLYEHYLPKDQFILEAGCGLGPKVLYFREQGVKVIGVDFVYSALQRLKSFSSPTPVSCCDVHDCPFPDNTFGAYLSMALWSISLTERRRRLKRPIGF